MAAILARFGRIDPCQKHVGPVLSGEKLVDQVALKRSLFDTFPAAIGGEMEGAGLAAAAHRHNIPWIVAKHAFTQPKRWVSLAVLFRISAACKPGPGGRHRQKALGPGGRAVFAPAGAREARPALLHGEFTNTSHIMNGVNVW
jgi:hypothetical protein